MINKNNLWFLTLFCLILVLGVYYVTLPSDDISNVMIESPKTQVVSDDSITALRVSLLEDRENTTKKLEKQLTDTKVSTKEKNNIYEEIKYLNEVQAKEEKLEKNIKSKLGLSCFVKIDRSNVDSICISNNKNKSIANNIMRLIQESSDTRLNITVKLQSK